MRIRQGRERQSYAVTYREAQQIIVGSIAADVQSRSRAYLLLKQHGQITCTRTEPAACESCPVSMTCAFRISERDGGRSLVT